MKGKRGLEFSFAWIFAFIAGAVILFLAIYFASKLINVGSYEVDTKTAKQLSILFDPLETGLASTKTTKAEISKDTRIYLGCEDKGDFGNLEISSSSRYFGKWSSPSLNISINKYVFSDEVLEGKEFYYISKPFEFPFKVSEIIMMYNKKYCFIDTDFEIENIEKENCSSDSIKVCFDSNSGECNISVFGLCSGYNCESEYDYGYVEKNGEELYYAGNLMYGAIFSSPNLYECNVKRLMKRLSHISNLYMEEAIFLEGREINTNLEGDLSILASLASKLEKSEELISLKEVAYDIKIKNDALGDKAIF